VRILLLSGAEQDVVIRSPLRPHRAGVLYAHDASWVVACSPLAEVVHRGLPEEEDVKSAVADNRIAAPGAQARPCAKRRGEFDGRASIRVMRDPGRKASVP
jgi:hypothetical protein